MGGTFQPNCKDTLFLSIPLQFLRNTYYYRFPCHCVAALLVGEGETKVDGEGEGEDEYEVVDDTEASNNKGESWWALFKSSRENSLEVLMKPIYLKVRSTCEYFPP